MSGEEKCPYCGDKFSIDQDDHHPGRVTCPTCGGKFGAEHDEGYPNTQRDNRTGQDLRGFGEAHVRDTPEPGAINHPEDCECPECVDLAPKTESTMFDKFMDRIIKEERKPFNLVIKDSPQRIRAARNQEHPLGRIRVRGR